MMVAEVFSFHLAELGGGGSGESQDFSVLGGIFLVIFPFQDKEDVEKIGSPLIGSAAQVYISKASGLTPCLQQKRKCSWLVCFFPTPLS